MENKDVHAVIDNTHLYKMVPGTDGKRRLVKFPVQDWKNIGNIYDVAKEHGVSHVWIMPGSKPDNPDLSEWLTPIDYNIFVSRQSAKDENSSVQYARVQKIGQYGNVLIGFIGRGRWDWHVQHPIDILSTVAYLQEVLGVSVQWSPRHMDELLLKKHLDTGRKGEWSREPETDLSKLPFKESARDLVFLRGLEDEDVGRYIHEFDKNSAYLNACRMVPVGCGEPIHVYGTPSNRRLPGVYRVEVTSVVPPFDGNFLPLPFPYKTEWVTAEQLKFADEVGCAYTIKEAYQFNESHKILRTWAESLWSARRDLKKPSAKFSYGPGRENAYYTIKDIALVSVGQFGATRYQHKYMRPNWWADIVGGSRAVLLHNIASFLLKGPAPFLVYTDALFFVSDEQEPRKAFPHMFGREEELGGFKCVYNNAIKITPEIVQASRESRPGAMVTMLNRIARIHKSGDAAA